MVWVVGLEPTPEASKAAPTLPTELYPVAIGRYVDLLSIDYLSLQQILIICNMLVAH